MQTPSQETADSILLPQTPRRRRLTVRVWVTLALLALLLLGGIGTAGAIVMLEDSDGSVEGY